MTREAAVMVMVAVAVVLLGLAAWVWVRRARRDRTPLIQPAELNDADVLRETIDALYVATTVHDAPLERIAAPGLGYRSPATVTVTDSAVALDLTNQPRITIGADRISAADLARAAVLAMGGQGAGGKPDFAQGGAPDGSKAEDGLAAVRAALAG